MKKKPACRIRNWREYDHALTQRGSLTVWLSQDVLDQWRTTVRTGQRGASDTYTDVAITTMATPQAVYHLPGRATPGLLPSLFTLLAGVAGEIAQVSADGAYEQRPCYTAIAGRGALAAIPRVRAMALN